MRNALIVNLAYLHDLPLLTVADEVKASLSTIRKVLKASKNEVHLEEQSKKFENKALREKVVSNFIKRTLEESKRVLFTKDVRLSLMKEKGIYKSISTVRRLMLK